MGNALCVLLGWALPFLCPSSPTSMPATSPPATSSPITDSPMTTSSPVVSGGWYISTTKGASCDMTCNEANAPKCNVNAIQKLTSFETLFSLERVLGSICSAYGVTGGYITGDVPGILDNNMCLFWSNTNAANVACDVGVADVYRFCCCSDNDEDCPSDAVPNIPSGMNTDWYLSGLQGDDCMQVCDKVDGGGLSCHNAMKYVDSLESVLFVSQNLNSNSALQRQCNALLHDLNPIDTFPHMLTAGSPRFPIYECYEKRTDDVDGSRTGCSFATGENDLRFCCCSSNGVPNCPLLI